MRARAAELLKRQSGLAIAAAILGALCVVAVPLVSAIDADRVARRREEALVVHGIETLLRELSMRQLSESVWDEAVLHLDNAFDRKWAEEDIGVYMAESYGVDYVLIVDGGNEPLIAMRGTEAVDPLSLPEFSTRARRLLANIRAQEAGLAPIDERVAAGLTMSDPVYAGQFAMMGGRPHAVFASLVQPDFGEILPKGPASPVILTARELDSDMLATLADRLLLDDASIAPVGHDLKSGRAHAPFPDARGEPVAYIEWTPQTAAALLARRALPPVLIVVGALGLVAFLLRRANRRVTENLRVSEARATHLAYHDALTGLANRRLFADRLEGALAQLRRDGVPFAVHCIDLDRFKEINDTFGHAAGDELIRAVTRTLAQLCGPADTLARLGGDEFAILQAGVGVRLAGSLAEQVVKALASPVDLAAGRVFIGASNGVALIDNGMSDAAECLRRADLALYQAKERGRGRYVLFDQAMDAALRTRCEIREELRAALKNQELSLVYQPQMRGDSLHGVEALVRWNHPVRGMLSPGLFIPIAEESGLIEPLGLFTLRRAFLDSRQLPGVMIGVNVSAAQLRLPAFVDQVSGLITETGADARQIELEITEGLLLGDDPAIKARLEALRQMGFRIALDDFGTGYSSLSYLQRYPIDRIKIDRAFISNLDANGDADAVIAAIVRLARALRLDVIAEGVETDLQRIRLLAAGCSDFQGFLFGRPTPLDALLEASAPAAPADADPAIPARKRA